VGIWVHYQVTVHKLCPINTDAFKHVPEIGICIEKCQNNFNVKLRYVLFGKETCYKGNSVLCARAGSSKF
jgi:hypothetical protein